ncbi:MAG TPA: hypothetical protein DCS93_10990 [Microscillaceae bacterium]|nr:hypothetical protein [Microscillaceae bacterium]
MKPEEKIRQGYIDYILEHNHPPKSVYALCKSIKMKEDVFYEHYTSVNVIESDIWTSFFQDTINRIEQDEVYSTYTVREKVVAFYYTWIEELKSNRSFIVAVYQAKKDRGIRLEDFKVLKSFKQAFQDYMTNLVNEGLESGEIAERPYITTQYSKALWVQTLTILRFWIKDHSKGFEKTDIYIEKVANLGFDLMGKTPLDSAFDLVKFAFQNRMS